MLRDHVGLSSYLPAIRNMARSSPLLLICIAAVGPLAASEGGSMVEGNFGSAGLPRKLVLDQMCLSWPLA